MKVILSQAVYNKYKMLGIYLQRVEINTQDAGFISVSRR